jgi:hypothetical protein
VPFPPRRAAAIDSSRVAAFFVGGKRSVRRGSPRPRRQAVLEKPDPGHGSRGAPFGRVAQRPAEQHPTAWRRWLARTWR